MGQGFESLKTHQYALLAQSVEHLTLNQGVRGSSPRWRTIMVGIVQLVERQIVVLVVKGSSPFIHPIFFLGSLAQSVEHMTFNHGVRGSIPR